MKLRNGFVSNSSSSSYVCDVCGRSAVSYEGKQEVGMTECSNGHVFCEGHTIEPPKEPEKTVDEKRTIILEKIKAEPDKYDFKMSVVRAIENFDKIIINRTYGNMFPEPSYDELPAEMCPICSLSVIPNEYVVKYLLERSGVSAQDCLNEMRNKFKTYKGMNTHFNKGSKK